MKEQSHQCQRTISGGNLQGAASDGCASLFAASFGQQAGLRLGIQHELSDYFRHNGSQITALRVRRPADLEHQERLTRLLQVCAPIYQTVIPRAHASWTSVDHTAYLACIEEQLATPIAILSCGPTAKDTCLCGPFTL